MDDSSSYLSTAQVFDDHTTTDNEGLNHNIAQVYDVTSSDSESASDPDDDDENRENENSILDNNDLRDEPEEDDSRSQSTTSSQYIEQEQRGNRNRNLQNADIDTLSESTFNSGNEISTIYDGSVYMYTMPDVQQGFTITGSEMEQESCLECMANRRTIIVSEMEQESCLVCMVNRRTIIVSEMEQESCLIGMVNRRTIIELRRERERIRAQQVEQYRELEPERQHSFHQTVQVLLAYLSVAFCVAMKGFMDSDHYATAIRHQTVLAWLGELASKEPASQSVLCL